MSEKKTDKTDKEPTPKRDKAIKTAGVAVGIGSAAIVAALLYANRRKKGDKGEK